MTNLCPRCGTPRLAAFCQKCGLDFRTLDAQAVPPQQQLPPPPPLYGATGPQPFQVSPPQTPLYQAPPPPPPPYQAPPPPPPFYPPPPPPPLQPAEPLQAPISEPPVPQVQTFGQPTYQPFGQPPATASVCPRCYAPLFAGVSRCGNCGYETGTAWGMAPATHRSPALPIALALLGVGCLAVAGAVFVVAQNSGSSASPTPTTVAAASATPTTEATPTETAKPTATPKASAGEGTPEPSPPFTWTSYKSPDGKWSTKFPGSGTPTKTTSTSGTGTYAATEISYEVYYAGVEYAVAYMDLNPSLVSGMDPEALLDVMEMSMTSGAGTTDVVSTASTVGTHPARDVSLTAMGQQMTMRIFFVGSRFYILMVASAPGASVYPQHFFGQFQLV